MSLYRFKGRATGADPTGYYYPRWDRAQNISVVAATKSEATRKAMVMLGDHPRFGNAHYYGWTIKWDSIEEEPALHEERERIAQAIERRKRDMADGYADIARAMLEAGMEEAARIAREAT